MDTSLLVNATAQPVSAIVTVYNPPALPTRRPMAALQVHRVAAVGPALAGFLSRSLRREQVQPPRRAPTSPKKRPRSAWTAATSPTPRRKASTRRSSFATPAKAPPLAASRARRFFPPAADGTAGQRRQSRSFHEFRRPLHCLQFRSDQHRYRARPQVARSISATPVSARTRRLALLLRN